MLKTAQDCGFYPYGAVFFCKRKIFGYLRLSSVSLFLSVWFLQRIFLMVRLLYSSLKALCKAFIGAGVSF